MQALAAIYARISLDRKEGEGVARQVADCRKLAAQHGHTNLVEYVDNDISATGNKPRPAWKQLLHDLTAGQLDAVYAYHPDRLYRRPMDMEGFIDVVQAAGVKVYTVRAGDYDLSTASGRMVARILGTSNRHEVERIGERVSRAKAERAAQGRPPGGGLRPFGYTRDGMHLEPDEAKALHGAALRIAAGGTLSQEVRRLNMAGWTTTGNRPWSVPALGRVLTSARIAGLRSYKGEVIGPAAWPAIIDEDTWRRIVAMAAARKRGRPIGERHLLSALIVCPHCGGNLYATAKDYACRPATRGGCGGASITIRGADGRVTEEVDRILDDPNLTLWIAQGARGLDLDAEIRAIEEKQVALARRWALDELTTDAYDEARRTLDKRLRELGEVQAPPPRAPDLAILRASWRGGANADRRLVVQALLEVPIGLNPERIRPPGDRLRIDPKWA